jgi:N-methylhydantoinase B
MMCHAGLRRRRPETNEYYCFLETFGGGYGGRFASDGPDAVQTHGQNTENAPVEETELNYPVRVARLSLVEDSEGPGRFRGGLGLRKDFVFDRATTFTVLADRTLAGPAGAFGGRAGKPAEYVLIRAGVETRIGAKTTIEVEAGDTVSYRTCGGGGYGPPEERDRELVARDVREEKGQPAASPRGVRVAAVDPITFEVIRNALVAATDEMALALKRSAYSTNIKTRSDFSCAFFDAQLRSVAQGFAQPVHLGSMVEQVPNAVRAYGAENLAAGDVLVTNDPHPSGVHLNDVSLISPVHHEGELIGYVANLAHHVDVGGGAPASIGAFKEVFQEGVIIPPVKLVEGGAIVKDVFKLILAQIRSKHETAATSAPDRRERHGRAPRARARRASRARHDPRDDGGAARVHRAAHAGRARRAPARRLRGRGLGRHRRLHRRDRRLKVRSRSTPTAPLRHDRLRPAAPRPGQLDLRDVVLGLRLRLKCLIDPDLPVNDGFYRLISVEAPAGTVVNCSWPGPVVGGWETHARLIEVIVRALLPAFPERLPAGTKGMMCQAGFGSLDIEAGKYTCFYDTFAGGYGGRYASDGPDAVQSHSQNTENAPIEETELNYPVRINGLSLVEDSEGPGRFRGGLGLRKDYLFDLHTDLHRPRRPDKAGPWGAFGGTRAGRRVRARPRRRRDEALSKTTLDLVPGDVISVRTAAAAATGRPRSATPSGAARRARGQGQRRAGTRAVPRGDRRPPLDEAATEALRA